MTSARPDRDPAWDDALLVLAALAVDPHGLGGVRLRASPGPARERWLSLFAKRMPAGTPVRRLPIGVSEERLVGGLDLAATLTAGRPVHQAGVLAEADGGLVIAAMAERLGALAAAKLAEAIDTATIATGHRDGAVPARIGAVLLDEGLEAEDGPPDIVVERLAFRIDLDGLARAATRDEPHSAPEIAAARALLAKVVVDDTAIGALCETAAALDVASLRAPILALRAARVLAALDQRRTVETEDLATAVRLVLVPRARRLPAPPDEENADAPPPPPPETADDSAADSDEVDADALADQLIEAARAALPADLLARLALSAKPVGRGGGDGRKAAATKALRRGRPIGTRAGDPRRGLRLAVVETLRAAAPWQPLRRGQRTGPAPLVEVRRDDLRVKRFEQPRRTATVFVVDASGSTALARLAEAKGAVELMLAQAYVRRDEVALIAVRGKGADLLLPPTRSLARAKRALAALPGGGGTPLAAGIDAARALADAIGRKGATPLLVFLTDGQANVARDGSGGREKAGAEALAAASVLKAQRFASLLVDTSPRAQDRARALAGAMGARYLALPHADSGTIAAAATAAAKAAVA